MRILQVHNRYRSSLPSGENRVVDLECSSLRSHGHEVTQFSRSSDEIEGWPRAKRALVAGRVLWSTDAYRGVQQAIRHHRPDVVHVHNVYPLLSSSVLYACARQRVPVVTTLHNYRLVCTSGSMFRDGAVCGDCVGHLPVSAVQHGCYRGSKLATVPVAAAAQAHRRSWRTLVSGYVCISASQRDLLASFDLPSDRVFVKHNLVPYVAAPSPSSEPGDTVVFVGRLDEAKGIPLLMHAWDRYSASGRSGALRLVIAGAGPLGDDVSAWARGRSDVEVVGLLTPEACRTLMASARVAVAPAQWLEPFGLVVVEAMAAGVGLVAPASGAFPELLVDGEEGRLFEPGSATSLAECFEEAEQSPERYQQFGRNARHAYEERFDPDDNIQQLLSIYQFAIDNPIWAGGHHRHMAALAGAPGFDRGKPPQPVVSSTE